MAHAHRTPGVRMPDPLTSSRRRALRRLGTVKTMGLGAIGDIGGYSFGSVDKLTWSGESEWDDANDEEGVVHEDTENSSLDDADTVQMGYPLGDPMLSSKLVGLWPLQESSGSTAYDFSGNGEDGTVEGPTQDETGLLSTSAYKFDESNDDYVGLGDFMHDYLDGGSLSLAGWFYVTKSEDWNGLFQNRPDGDDRWTGFEYNSEDTELGFGVDEGGEGNGGAISDTSIQMNDEWAFVTGTYNYDNGDAVLYRDGSEIESGDIGSGNEIVSASTDIGKKGDADENYLDGRACMVMAFDEVLSSSEVQDLYDVVDAPGTLTTATKSFSSSKEPDLTDLEYSRNGEDITLTVIGSPGSGSEETVEQDLDGETNYSLSWDDSHTDFRVEISHSTADPETTPTLKSITLTA